MSLQSCLGSVDWPFTWPRSIAVATILVDKGLVAPFEAGHKEMNDNKIDFKTNVDILSEINFSSIPDMFYPC